MAIKEDAIVDASIVDSLNKPSGGHQIVIADDREDTRTDEEKAAEEAYQQQVVSTKPGVDYAARWVKKGQAYRYGYRKHTLTDSQGLALEGITTTANVSDTTQIAPLVEKAGLPEGTLIVADKGYTSQKNRAALKALKLEDGIMRKATRGKPLAASQEHLNSLISTTRWAIERTFGSIIRWFHGRRCRYRGLRKAHHQNLIESLTYNLKRAPQLIIAQG